MDTRVIKARLKRLDEYLKSLARFESITLEEYRKSDDIQLVHEYLEIDAEIVHRNLTQNLSDFNRFAQSIIRYLKL